MNLLKLLKPKACIDYIYDDYTARQALEKMRHNGFTAVPVINRAGEYVKTVSEGDFLRFFLDKQMNGVRDMESFSVKDLPGQARMKPVYVYATVEELILLSMDQNFIPVIDDRNIFIGIVTRRDILQYCYNTLKEYHERRTVETAVK